MRVDVAIVGGGIVGFSIARALSPHARVAVLEREAHAGHHSTGRSAAIFVQPYERLPVRALSAASRPRYEGALGEAAGAPILRPRGVLIFAAPAKTGELGVTDHGMGGMDESLQRIDAARVLELCPALRPEAVGAGVWDAGACDIDVDLLLQAYVKAARAAGAEILFDAGLERLDRRPGGWRLAAAGGRELEAEVVIDAAGAWAGQVAAMAGASPISVEPRLRTAMTIDAPAGHDISAWPMTAPVEENLYFKPDAGRLMVSLSEERPVEPFDAWPRDEDVAEAIERLQQVADIEVVRAPRAWAGLRTFSPDRLPLLGWDPSAGGFCWAAALGGFGVQTSAAVGELIASVATGRPELSPLDEAVRAAVSPARYHPQAAASAHHRLKG